MVLVIYGYIQQICALLGIPITGRDIFENVPALYTVNGITFSRFYSLGGEPRQYGSFIIGSIFFYMYYYYNNTNLYIKIIILLMFISLLLTLSVSCVVITLLSSVVILLDSIYYKRMELFIKLSFYVIIVLCALYIAGLFEYITHRYYTYFGPFNLLMTTGEVHPNIHAQANNIALMKYILNIFDLNPIHSFIGYGYSNYSTGVFEILKTYFDTNLYTLGKIDTPSAYLFVILVENGLIGIIILLLMFLYTLKLSNRLLIYYKKTSNVVEIHRMILLRYAFITFFMSFLIESNFHFSIVMGLIIGKLNNLSKVIPVLQSYENTTP
ncbi:MAG: hypothetical protein HQL06_04705 [Nitrospirae bacterium]|nr:hypothetical protein [Nitrospirota bacterium]